MKRPLLVLGLAFTCSVITLRILGITHLFLASVACMASGVCFVGSSLPSARYLKILLLGGALAAMSLGIYQLRVIQPCLQLSGHTVEVTGVVVDIQHSGKATVLECLVQVENSTGLPHRIRMQLRSFQGEEGILGEGFHGRVRLDLPPNYDTVYRNAGRGISLTGELLGAMVETKEHPFPLDALAAQVRRRMLDNLSYHLEGDDFGLVVSLIMGDSSRLHPQWEESMRRSGLMHLMAVSGTHMAILLELCTQLLRWLRLDRRKAGLLSLPLLWFYALLCGFSPSVIRSVVMLSIAVVGDAFFLQKDSMVSLGVACVVSLLTNPYIACNVGFQMSYVAVMGIRLFSLPIRRTLQAKIPWVIPEKILFALCSSLSAWMAVLPLSAWHFGYISLLSPISNLLVTGAIPIAMLTGILIGLFGNLAKPFFALLSVVTKLALAVIVQSATLISRIPFSTIPMERTWKYLFLIFFCIMAFFAYRHREQVSCMLFAGWALLTVFLVATAISNFLGIGQVEILEWEQGAVVRYHNYAVVINPQRKEMGNSLEGVDTIALLLIEEEQLFQTSWVAELAKTARIQQVVAPDTPYVRHYLESIGIQEPLPLQSFVYTFLEEVQLEYDQHGEITLRYHSR